MAKIEVEYDELMRIGMIASIGAMIHAVMIPALHEIKEDLDTAPSLTALDHLYEEIEKMLEGTFKSPS